MNVPGFTRNEQARGFEPPFSNRHDGVEYIGDKLAHVGMYAPIIISDMYQATHPATWALKGCLWFPIHTLWLFTVGWVLALIGIVVALVGDSWNKMKERQ